MSLLRRKEKDMKHELFSVWKVNEGSKVIWKVQMPKGIMSFKTKKQALKVVEVFSKGDEEA